MQPAALTGVLLRFSQGGVLALIALGLLWEWWLAPLRPGGSMLALKVLPLTLTLPGLLRGRRYTFQWSSMLLLAYLAEGATRAFTDRGTSAALAWVELLLALATFTSVIFYARLTRPSALTARQTP